MKVYDFNEEQVIKRVQLFPDDICNNLWVAYHGTSSVYEKSIKKQGLQWMSNVATRSEVARVVDIFKKMSWAGRHGGGFPALKPFTLMHDFANSNVKPLYLAESSFRALLYATHDYAGGETARALRHAIGDIEVYVSSSELRAEHLEYLWLEYNQLRDRGAKPGDPPAEVDLNWLKDELSNLMELKTRATEPYEKHSHGVVYAVKFEPNDINYLEYHSSMGLKATNSINFKKIIGMVRVPKNFDYHFRDDPYRWRAITSDFGVIASLLHNSQQGL